MNSFTSEPTVVAASADTRGGLFRTAKGENLAFTFVLLTSLFLLWGFCNGMIDVLNKHFQDTLHINKEQSGLVQAANYLAYFLMAIPAGLVAKKFGYKGGILVGLSLIAAGAFWFVPATNIDTYWAFLLGLFVIGAGMTCLETIANPYATVLGSPESGPTRINIAQTLNGAGWILGPIVGGYFVFSHSDGASANAGLSTPYIAIGIFVVVLIAVFAVSRVPDLHGEDPSRESKPGLNRSKPSRAQSAAIVVVLGATCGLLYFFIAPILGLVWTLLHLNQTIFQPVKYGLLVVAYMAAYLLVSRNWDMFRRTHFTLGIVAEFLYVAAQTGIFSFFVNYVVENDPGVTRLQAARWLGAIGFVLFMIGRLCGSAVISQFKPERVLAVYSLFNVVLVGITIGGGKAGLYAMFATFFFMSIGFPTIFALGIRGLGEHTKLGSSLIVMSIVGGAIAPPFMGHIADQHSMRVGFIVPLVCFVFIVLYGFLWPKFSKLNSRRTCLSLSTKGVTLLRSVRWSCSIPRIGASIVALSSLTFLHAQSATAPTVSQDPASIDQTWQAATSKYDGARAALLRDVDTADHQGPFRPDWESLQKYEPPEWYKDAKFGIFIHWGLYSVPSFGNEWYPRNMYRDESDEYKHHIATYGSVEKFGYKDFIPMFKAEKFDAAAWAELFKKAGAKYVVPVAEHHDGFAMYDSGLSDWTAAKMGPHRDTTGELAKAARAAGLHFGISSHRVEHNFFLGVGREIPSDINDPQYAAFYGPAHTWISPWGAPLSNDFTYVSTAWADDWLARSSELVEKYHPDIVYFDWWIGQASIRGNLTRFAAFYYNSSLKYGDHIGVINYKDYAMQEHAGVLDIERGQLGDMRSLYWQTDTSISNKSWGYINGDTFKSPEFIIHQLIDIVSKNGNLLLNIGPRSDGTIPDEVQRVLLDVGAWLSVNGEAIYGTRPWRVYGEGPTKVAAGSFHDTDTTSYKPEDFRFTAKGDVLYAIGLAWPTNGEAVIHSLAQTAGSQRVRSATLLGNNVELRFEQRADGLYLQLPAQTTSKYAYVVRVTFDNPSR